MFPTNEEIMAAIETLENCAKQDGWFLIHETRSIYNAAEALRSVLHYEASDREGRKG